ncbi:MAG: hypothetical protein NTY17_00300 [Planctomycetia bacterium]|nr:hypothetical protein [Planctomycetia bacterium]
MTRHNTEIDLLRQQRLAHHPPAVDVSERVAETIAVQLAHRHWATTRTMAACAVFGATTAVVFASAAWLLPTQMVEAESPAAVLLDAYGVSVEMFLPPASRR